MNPLHRRPASRQPVHHQAPVPHAELGAGIDEDVEIEILRVIRLVARLLATTFVKIVTRVPVIHNFRCNLHTDERTSWDDKRRYVFPVHVGRKSARRLATQHFVVAERYRHSRRNN